MEIFTCECWNLVASCDLAIFIQYLLVGPHIWIRLRLVRNKSRGVTCLRCTAGGSLALVLPSWRLFYRSAACRWTENNGHPFWTRILPSSSGHPQTTNAVFDLQRSPAWAMWGLDEMLWLAALAIHHLWFPKMNQVEYSLSSVLSSGNLQWVHRNQFWQ